MVKITNLTSTPRDLYVTDGRIPIGPGETLDVELDPRIEEYYLSSSMWEISAEDEIETWRIMYTELTGKKPDMRWKIPRLMEEIDGWQSR